MADYFGVELTAQEAWFLADHLHAGSFPWTLAITGAYTNPAERGFFNEQMTKQLSEESSTRPIPVMSENGVVRTDVASWIRTVCASRQWLTWQITRSSDPNAIGRGVLARTDVFPNVVVALRWAQMVAFTPMEVAYSEALVPIITTGIEEKAPARFEDFTIKMDAGARADQLIKDGADSYEVAQSLGVPESAANLMAFARSEEVVNVEVQAHDAVNGSRRETDVSVNLLNTVAGRILVSPPAGGLREGGESVFSPADPFAVAVALRDLTARLPSGTWFPQENLTL